MMRFSEAIELGSTLIGEDDTCFYNPHRRCGCAHGAAWAAIGVLEGRENGVSYSGRFFPICNLRISKEECVILTGRSSMEFSYFGRTQGCTLGEIVIVSHDADDLPRLELARRIRIIEDMHPETAGLVQGVRDSVRAQAALLARS